MKETVTTDNVKYLFLQKATQADIFVNVFAKYETLPICHPRYFLYIRSFNAEHNDQDVVHQLLQ